MAETGTTIPFVAAGPYPVRTGNRVAPLVDGEAAFRRICAATEAARHRVWVTVTFLWDTFEMPDGRGSFFDVLDRAATRGVDVRVIFWRHDAETAALATNAFWGSPDHVAGLEARGSGVSIRWDRARPRCCQHQKSWLMPPTNAIAASPPASITTATTRPRAASRTTSPAANGRSSSSTAPPSLPPGPRSTSRTSCVRPRSRHLRALRRHPAACGDT